MPPPSEIELPLRVKAPATGLNVIPLKDVPAENVFVFSNRLVPVKIRKSPADGRVLQLPGVSQRLLSPEAPVHVEVPALRGVTAKLNNKMRAAKENAVNTDVRCTGWSFFINMTMIWFCGV